MANPYYQGPDRNTLALMPQFDIPKPLSVFDVWSPEKDLAMERAQQQMEIERMDAERRKQEEQRLAEISAQMGQLPEDPVDRYTKLGRQYIQAGLLKEAGEAERIAGMYRDDRASAEQRAMTRDYYKSIMNREPKAPSFDADQYEVTLPDGKTQLLSSSIPEQRAAIQEALRNQYPVQQRKPVAPVSEQQVIQNALMRHALENMGVTLDTSQFQTNQTSAPRGVVPGPGPSPTPSPTQTPPPMTPEAQKRAAERERLKAEQQRILAGVKG